MTIKLLTPNELRNSHPVHVVTMDADWLNEFQDVYKQVRAIDGDVKLEDFYRAILRRGLFRVRADYLELFMECANNPDWVPNHTDTPLLDQMIPDILITIVENKKENTK